MTDATVGPAAGPQADPEPPTATGPQEPAAPEPWSTSVDLREACRPNYWMFEDEVTDAQRQLLADLGMTFTEDTTDYTARCELVETLQGLDEEEHPGAAELAELIDDTLCPTDCNDCWSSEREWIFDTVNGAIAAYAQSHPDVMWVVTCWRGDTVCVDEVDLDALESLYHRRITSGYSDIDVKLHQDDGPFGEIAFDRMAFEIHALTEEAERKLVRHHYERCSSDDALDFRPIQAASPQLRALMLHLVTDHGEVELPEYLDLPNYNGEPRRRAYGTLEEADPEELAFIATPLVGLDAEQIGYALSLLPACESRWPDLVAAVAAAAAA